MIYTTDLTDANTGRKRKTCLRSLWNALMYVVKTRCQWRMLPNDFPTRQSVYYYYGKWIDAKLLDMILEKLRSKIRGIMGRKPLPHWVLRRVRGFAGQ